MGGEVMKLEANTGHHFALCGQVIVYSLPLVSREMAAYANVDLHGAGFYHVEMFLTGCGYLF